MEAATNLNAPYDIPGPRISVKGIADRGIEKMLSMPDDASVAASHARLAEADGPDPPIVSTTLGHFASKDIKAVNVEEVTHHLDENQGAWDCIVDSHIDFTCQFANSWHQELDPTRNYNDHFHLGPARPLFYSLTSDFYHDLFKPPETSGLDEHDITPDIFWDLRYLFIPISYALTETQSHLSLVVISPEARTIDYHDSSSNYGIQSQADNKPDAWSTGIEHIVKWMSDLLEDVAPGAQRFIPAEWRYREDACPAQNALGVDCGMYVLSIAQALAFGYQHYEGLRPGRLVFSNDHMASMSGARRYRVTQDFLQKGFEFYEPPAGRPRANLQYYPVLDTRPSNSLGFGWQLNSPDYNFLQQLPPNVMRRRSCYATCDLIQLGEHCYRNLRFYEGYAEIGNSVSFKEFVEWVEELDDDRNRAIPDFGPESWPIKWVDPTEDHLETENGWPPAVLERFQWKVWD
ncbi:hypothetical protein PVAG01_08474 [Phlyctema vagabunda]|uniref:Ubiquitin-like protease family profile domain-containing protein n=1 Tax=Phlyctema vagabunda TaxID=108571 RepID=A0ABR4P9K6_9HELO